MGNGIAQVCAQAGYEVSLRDIEQRFVDNGMNTIKKNLARDVEKGRKKKSIWLPCWPRSNPRWI
jgi:3-hydroxybutyryl-CoA dehydrogenase